MKRVTAITLSTALGLVLLSATARGDCRRFVAVKHAPVVVEKAVVVEKVVAVTALTPVIAVGIPTYSAVYNPYHAGAPVPPVAAQPSGETAPAWAREIVDGFKVLKDSQLGLDRRLRVLEERLLGRQPSGEPRRPVEPMPGADRQPDPFRPPAKPEAQPQGLKQGRLDAPRCASCHDSSVSREEGGGFTLTERGSVARLAPEQIGEVMRRVLLPESHKQRMPKGKPFTAEEKVRFLEDFSRALGIEQ